MVLLKPLFNWCPDHSPCAQIDHGLNLTTHLHTVLSVRLSGAITPVPLHTNGGTETILVYANWRSCPPNIQLHKYSEQLNCTRGISYRKLYFEKLSRKSYSKIYFLQVRPSTWGEQHKDEMFYQMLKYRYKVSCVSIYKESNYDDLWISMNGSDIFTMASRT